MWLAVRAIAVAAIIVSFVVQITGGLNPDVSWLLTVGERMLSGQHLYTDIHELNPPMSALLYLPFVALARAIGLAPEPIVVGAILLLAMGSIALSVAILRKGQSLAHHSQWGLIALVALTILPGANFGEREHIAVMLLLPLVAVGAVRCGGSTPSLVRLVVAGIAAGLAMTIKPHFALPVLVVSLYSASVARSWRPIFNLEHVLAGLILVGYWLAVWVRFPNFFSSMLPIASSAYLADRVPLGYLLLEPSLLFVATMLIGIAVLYRREVRDGPNPQFLFAAMGFFLVYLIQGKGFVYHLLPVVLLVSMVFAWCFVRRNANGPNKAIPLGLALALLAMPGMASTQGSSLRREAMNVLAPLGPGLKFANITSQLELASPLHRDLGGTLINSGPCLWITLGAIRRQMSAIDTATRQEMIALETYERTQLRDDMLANPPDIILAGADQFDWLAWASQDPVIADMLSGYELLAKIGPKTQPLQILRRNPP